MKNNKLEKYKRDSKNRIKSYKNNIALNRATKKFHDEITKADYSYNFTWLGVPIIKDPQDIQLRQELIWEVKPDLIIETGIAWGGSTLLSASMMQIMEYCKYIKKGDVIGIDLGMKGYSKDILKQHPLGKKIIAIEGSSTDPKIVERVKKIAKNKKRVLVVLDSNHTHEHVLAELNMYSPLISVGSYCIVEDTGIEDQKINSMGNRPWGKGNNPKTAVREFLKKNKKFKIQKELEQKILITNSPDGILKRVK